MLSKRVTMVALFALLGACSTPDSELVAKVNGDGITKKQFESEVERNLARYKGQGRELPPGIEVRIRESVLRRMIDDKIIEQKAKSLGLEVTNQELEAKFKEHKDRFRTAEAFDDYLKRSGNTVENMKDDLKRNLLRDRVVEKLSGAVDVTDDEVKKYYDDNLPRFTDREQIRASRILIRVMPNATAAEKRAAQKEAKSIYAKLKKGADFAAIAKQSSKGPEAANGGDLGWITRGRMTPEFDNVAFTLEPNKMSNVIETKLGYEVVKVLEKKPEHQRTLDEVKESIKNSLLARKKNEKRRDVLRDLKANAKVEQLVKFEQPPMPSAMPPRLATPGVSPPAPNGLPPGHPALPPGHPAPAQGGATPAAAPHLAPPVGTPPPGAPPATK
jgi:parvulin-like peptidyl-prolyl isomerase